MKRVSVDMRFIYSFILVRFKQMVYVIFFASQIPAFATDEKNLFYSVPNNKDKNRLY